MREKSEMSREKILTVFHQLIIKQGYTKTTLRQIADECHMGKGNVSFYFARKEDIMIAFSLSYFEKTKDAVEQIVACDDILLKFFLQHLLLCFTASNRAYTYRFLAEMSENPLYLLRVSQYYAAETYPAIRKYADISEEDALTACIFVTYGTYGVVRKKFYDDQPFDYKEIFCMFAASLLHHLGVDQLCTYIERTLDLFEELDKTVLLAIGKE